ncbi:hypothetical protein M5W83_15850 [Paenibacillus thiaminolyticus]|uniref:Uncharacterized protein n=1 Tax=Paenibacillus thiaminolyticus TaxID=49283 RepID=A0ABT4FWS9_PANTH|nr:hypothetical protein [Paenibacillus thiaminolyticus]MCY9535807.1 hypothetical protein [Paenibacillus thiaminolyticus]MCY9605416.1 hypothetical protein [Paenibacillus thiaminolyticus]MCY9608619.1 hypothetical protein [Paenibacillus thiaminolyticus]MCY9613365.1 hypothetical protein [Paenibacillus thiaminolyticus]MCY9619539.1 hypothetical protein [Paenibacillus thiaminolyticus]
MRTKPGPDGSLPGSSSQAALSSTGSPHSRSRSRIAGPLHDPAWRFKIIRLAPAEPMPAAASGRRAASGACSQRTSTPGGASAAFGRSAAA